MKYIIFLISLVGVIISHKKFKNWYNPYTVFNVLWTLVGILIAIGNENIYTPTGEAILCICIGIIAFNLSMISPHLVLGKSSKKFNIFIEKQFWLDTERAYIISVVVLIFSGLIAAKAISSFVAGNSFSDIRTDYYAISSTENMWLYYAKDYILYPFRYVVIISSVIALFSNENKKYLLLANSLCIVILQSITNGGRYILMNSIFMFICGYCLFANKQKIQFKQKIALLFLVIILSYMIIFLTNNRNSFITKDMSTLQRLYLTIYEYFAGSVTYLGEVVKKTPQLIGMTKGVNFVAGWIIPICSIFTFCGLMPYPQILNIIGLYACEVLKIGPKTYYNAMPTIFGYFYIDGGILFVFIEAWILGYICKRIYLRSEKKDLLFKAFYILIFIQICNSSTRWFFFSTDYCLAYIYMLLIIRGGYTSKH